MIVYIKVSNTLIYSSPVTFSMKANLHYRKFPTACVSFDDVDVLKSAVLIGPNNSGKTNFVRIVRLLRDILLNDKYVIKSNLFSSDSVSEIALSFISEGEQYLFEFRYDTGKKEFLYERYARVLRDRYKNVREEDILIRDNVTGKHYAVDTELLKMMGSLSKKSIILSVVDTSLFPGIDLFRKRATSFAEKIDIVDMNNIPLQNTVRMMKTQGEKKEKLVRFIKSADLNLDDFRYLTDEEAGMMLSHGFDDDDLLPQEAVLSSAVSPEEMMHLASVYRGVTMPSVLFDSTGTKKMTALSSYIINALEEGRILVVDELDGSLHFALTRSVFSLFNNALNTKAQLIATVHDVSLLDCRTLFRKEQIWFTSKDRNDTYLYSLASFTAGKDGIRAESDLVEMYRRGYLGALPEPDFFELLSDIASDSAQKTD